MTYVRLACVFGRASMRGAARALPAQDVKIGAVYAVPATTFSRQSFRRAPRDRWGKFRRRSSRRPEGELLLEDDGKPDVSATKVAS